jgi:hypothetical protein
MAFPSKDFRDYLGPAPSPLKSGYALKPSERVAIFAGVGVAAGVIALFAGLREPFFVGWMIGFPAMILADRFARIRRADR